MGDLLKTGINTKYLAPIIVAYAAAAGLLGIDRVAQVQTLLQHAGFAGVAGIVMLVLQELFPRSVKEVLVFWRLRDRVPGCRAFTGFAPKDPRVDPTDLAVLLPSALMTPTEQNALWYKWLKATENDPAIADNHRRFLILRDSAVLLALLTLATPVLLLWPASDPARILMLGGGVLLTYVFVALSARNAAVRLVGNVVARKVGTA
ncbi:hypothetical protein [Sphingomonas sp. IW22]|uniref:hypothetical protein n=1 Tax=Sphingomonas sp. IW22 TaxID=3242489 RepID=UPI003522E148